MIERDGTDWVDEAWRRVVALAPAAGPVYLREPLLPDESYWFVRGVDEGVLSFRECPSDCFRRRKWGRSGPDHFDTPEGGPRHLFSKPGAPEAWLNREYVPHIAAWARLLVELGYERERCAFSHYRSYDRDLVTKSMGGSYETDIECYDREGRIHLQVEVKANPRQVAKIVTQLDSTPELSALPAAAAKELEYVLDLAPAHLWVVGPGSVDPAPHVYSVTVDGFDVAFERIGGIPQAL